MNERESAADAGAPQDRPEPESRGRADDAAGSEGTAPPRRLSGDPAVAPPSGAPAGAPRAVTVEFEVTTRGEPVGLRVIESGGPELDAALLRAVASWRYAPALREGVAVSVRWRARQLFGRASRPPRPPSDAGLA